MLCLEMAAFQFIHMFSGNELHDVSRQNRDDVTIEHAMGLTLVYDM